MGLKQTGKKFFISVALIFFAATSSIFAQAVSPQNLKTLCIENVCIQAEIVSLPEEREKGLMFRESLPDDRGMLFVFKEEARYSFWMKNMKFPLDIIWLDSNKNIVDIKEDAQPCQEPCQGFMPGKQASYVLEVNAGFIQKNKIKIGEKVSF